MDHGSKISPSCSDTLWISVSGSMVGTIWLAIAFRVRYGTSIELNLSCDIAKLQYHYIQNMQNMQNMQIVHISQKYVKYVKYAKHVNLCTTYISNS